MQFLENVEFLLKNSDNNINDDLIISKISELPNLLELDSIAQLDTFPEDYLLGVYLPLIIPLIFPILQAIFHELKQRFK